MPIPWLLLAPGARARPTRANLLNRVARLCHFYQSPSGASPHFNITSKASAPMIDETGACRSGGSTILRILTPNPSGLQTNERAGSETSGRYFASTSRRKR